MLRPIHEGLRMTVFHDLAYSYLEIILTHLTSETEEFKADLLEFIEIGQVHRCKKNLWNLKNLQIVIEPELQDWIDANINRIEVAWGVKKEAFLLPDSFIAELSIDQVMSEEHGQQIETQTFINYDKALTWLLE